MSSASPGPSTRDSEVVTPTPTVDFGSCEISMSVSPKICGIKRHHACHRYPSPTWRALHGGEEGGVMGFWTFRDKVLNAPSSPSVALALPDHVQAALPPSFEAVGEALAAGRSA